MPETLLQVRVANESALDFRKEQCHSVKVPLGPGQKLVNAGVGEQSRKIVDRGSRGVKGHFPVGNGREFRNEIADPGMPENFRRSAFDRHSHCAGK